MSIQTINPRLLDELSKKRNYITEITKKLKQLDKEYSRYVCLTDLKDFIIDLNNNKDIHEVKPNIIKNEVIYTLYKDYVDTSGIYLSSYHVIATLNKIFKKKRYYEGKIQHCCTEFICDNFEEKLEKVFEKIHEEYNSKVDTVIDYIDEFNFDDLKETIGDIFIE